MEVVKVHKRTLKSDILGCKLVLTIFDICETVKKEDGSEVVSFHQVYNVREIWTVFE